MMKRLKEDFKMCYGKHPNLILLYFFTNFSFRYCCILRILNVLNHSRKLKWLYYLLLPVHIINSYITGIQVNPMTEIGGE